MSKDKSKPTFTVRVHGEPVCIFWDHSIAESFAWMQAAVYGNGVDILIEGIPLLTRNFRQHVKITGIV